MQSYSLAVEVAKVIGFLVFLIVLSVISRRFFAYRGGAFEKGTRLAIVESLSLGRGRALCLIRAGKSFLVVGVTDQNITLIKDFASDDFKVELPCGGKESPGGSTSFRDFLSELKNRLLKRDYLFFVSLAVLALSLVILPAIPAAAAPSDIPVPNIDIRIGGETGQGGLLTALGILGALTVLTLAPAILILTTSFTRIVIVFSFLRAGLGTQQTPPNQVLIGLALLLTFFVMAPTWNQVNQVALVPYMAGEITAQEAFHRGSAPLKEFMLRQTREKDLALFVSLDQSGKTYTSPEDLSLLQVVPAFAISELKTAFEMGFILFLPFLVIDMVVASTLMSMGMLMLPPVLISLPFKILLFVLVDGWGLVARSLVASFR